MGCRGVHLALDDSDVAAFRAIDPNERADYVMEVLEEKFFPGDKSRYQESDKAWDAMHRALTDGELDWHNGSRIARRRTPAAARRVRPHRSRRVRLPQERGGLRLHVELVRRRGRLLPTRRRSGTLG